MAFFRTPQAWTKSDPPLQKCLGPAKIGLLTDFGRLQNQTLSLFEKNLKNDQKIDQKTDQKVGSILRRLFDQKTWLLSQALQSLSEPPNMSLRHGISPRPTSSRRALARRPSSRPVEIIYQISDQIAEKSTKNPIKSEKSL